MCLYTQRAASKFVKSRSQETVGRRQKAEGSRQYVFAVLKSLFAGQLTVSALIAEQLQAESRSCCSIRLSLPTAFCFLPSAFCLLFFDAPYVNNLAMKSLEQLLHHRMIFRYLAQPLLLA